MHPLQFSLITTLLILSCGPAAAQSTPYTADVEAEIRSLEDAERLAVLHGEVSALRELWAPDFMVNAPFNVITTSASEVIGLIEAGVIRYYRFEREVERILERDGLVIAMGNESVVPFLENGQPASAVRRRYTNVWLHDGSSWRLSARHAHIVAQ